MATRSSSNRGVSPNSTNGSSYSTGRNPGGTQHEKEYLVLLMENKKN